jgi:hypothetical protein
LDGGSARRKPATSNTNRINAHTDIHAPNGIRTHDPSVPSGEDGVKIISRAKTGLGTCEIWTSLTPRHRPPLAAVECLPISMTGRLSKISLSVSLCHTIFSKRIYGRKVRVFNVIYGMAVLVPSLC